MEAQKLNFRTIYNENYNNVLNYVNSKLHSIVDSEEVTNDVFIKVNKHLLNFDAGKSKFTTWLRTITNNCIIDFYRKDDSKKYTNVSDFANNETGKEVFQFVASTSNECNFAIENRELRAKIFKSIKSLKSNYRVVAYYYFVKDMDYDRICEICSMSMGTVKANIFRVRKMLQNELKNVRNMELAK